MIKTYPKKPQDIVGKWISSSWNGMSDIYKVVSATDKTITLQEYEWTTVAPLSNETANGDPTWNSTVIATNPDGTFKKKRVWDHTAPVGMNNYIDAKPIRKRVLYKDGGFTFKASWDGLGKNKIIADNDEEAKKLRWSTYWG